jgi:L-seryl-tRNA(Ser) seleniumtransferase
VEYGNAGVLKSFKHELESKISDKTCCLSYTVSYNTSGRGEIPLEEVIEAGKKNQVPLVVDAASMLPPVSNLQKYTDMGADVVCFSGGKGIRAPNSTGMILGNGKGADIVEAVRDHTYPHDGWGRGHKISKEQIIGLVAALEIFVDEGDAQYKDQMKTAKYLEKELKDIPNLDVVVIPNDESFHEHPIMPHVPRVLVEWDAKKVGMMARDLDRAMALDDPPVFLKERHYSNYFTPKDWRIIDTYFLRPGEEKIIAERMKKILTKGN